MFKNFEPILERKNQILFAVALFIGAGLCWTWLTPFPEVVALTERTWLWLKDRDNSALAGWAQLGGSLLLFGGALFVAFRQESGRHREQLEMQARQDNALCATLFAIFGDVRSHLEAYIGAAGRPVGSYVDFYEMDGLLQRLQALESREHDPYRMIWIRTARSVVWRTNKNLKLAQQLAQQGGLIMPHMLASLKSDVEKITEQEAEIAISLTQLIFRRNFSESKATQDFNAHVDKIIKASQAATGKK